mgnify:CR=1 FL=1
MSLERVLHVEDDESIRMVAEIALTDVAGFTLLSCEGGKAALAQVEAFSPQLILLDVMMPEMDGYETMRRIRSSEHIAAIPLIAVTAKAMKGDREKCLEAGASDYLAKPVVTDQLLGVLRQWLHR